MVIKIGHSRIDISPNESDRFYLLGYKTPLRNEPAKGIHDHIFANALLFDNGEDKLFLWTADLLELPDDTAMDIKTRLSDSFGINRDNIILGVMHDHSSVRDFHRNWEFGEYNPQYDEFLMDSVVRAYREAEGNKRIATARYGSELVKGYYSNRNHEGEPSDNKVQLVKFFDETGNAFAAIVNWAVHSTAMGASNMYLTGDLAGNVDRKLGEKWGFYPVMVNGAAGDSSNRFDRKGKGFDELERETDGLSALIAEIRTDEEIELGKIRKICLSHEIAPDIDKYHEHLRKSLEKIRKGEITAGGDMPQSHLIEKCEAELKKPAFKLNITFEVIDIGNLRFDVFPGELASAFGEELRSATEKKVIIAGYANGFHHYFLKKEDYGISFETIGNPVPPGESEKIIDKFKEANRLLDLNQEGTNG